MGHELIIFTCIGYTTKGSIHEGCYATQQITYVIQQHHGQPNLTRAKAFRVSKGELQNLQLVLSTLAVYRAAAYTCRLGMSKVVTALIHSSIFTKTSLSPLLTISCQQQTFTYHNIEADFQRRLYRIARRVFLLNLVPRGTCLSRPFLGHGDHIFGKVITKGLKNKTFKKGSSI